MATRENPTGLPLKTGALNTGALKTGAKRWLRDPSLQAVYDALDDEFALASLVSEARTRAQLTQEELADKLGMSASAIVRLENGTGAPSLATLRRIAKATGTRLEISFVPQRAAKKTKSNRAA